MKKVLISTVLCLAFLLTACGSRQKSALRSNPAADRPAEETTTFLENADKNPEIRDMNFLPQITVSAGEKLYQAKLYDNDAARELAERLPLELDMEELNGNEKFYYLPEPLPTDTESIGSIHAGDLMLYGSDCLVLFYEDFQTTYNYTRIGYLVEPDGLSGALGDGNVVVSFCQTE